MATSCLGGGQLIPDKAPLSGILARAAQDVRKKPEIAQVNTEYPFKDLYPAPLWKHFYETTKIYRPSRKIKNGKVVASEKKMGDYIKKIARQNGLEYKEDTVGNIFVFVPASKGMENAPKVAIQGHQDMVCVNEKGAHDFEKNPMKIKVENGKAGAVGTTSGADNGIGISAMLVIMEDRTLAHGPLTLYFSVDEEGDWTGVGNLKENPNILSDCEMLINVDADNVNVGYIGTAGAQETNASMKLNFAETKIEDPVQIKIDINGLTGGHSGVDIDKGRANGIKLISRALFELNNALPIDLVSIEGGTSKYSIAGKASAVIVISRKDVSAFEKLIEAEKEEFLTEYKKTDPDLKMSFEKLAEKPSKVIAGEQKDKIINMLNAFPYDVISMSKDIEKLVETSTNLALIETKGETLEISTTQRSSVDEAQDAASDSVRSVLMLGGFENKNISVNVVCPSCTPCVGSEVSRIYSKEYAEVTGKSAEVRAVHAGAEPSEIVKLYPKLKKNFIVIGPSYYQEHNPGEYVDIKSVGQFWNILTGMLSEIGKFFGGIGKSTLNVYCNWCLGSELPLSSCNFDFE